MFQTINVIASTSERHSDTAENAQNSMSSLELSSQHDAPNNLGENSIIRLHQLVDRFEFLRQARMRKSAGMRVFRARKSSHVRDPTLYCCLKDTISHFILAKERAMLELIPPYCLISSLRDYIASIIRSGWIMSFLIGSIPSLLQW